MTSLAIHTCNEVLSVVLLSEGGVLDKRLLPGQKQHSARLLPLIDDILRSNNLTARELDSFGVAVGVGSFTGIRVGIATVKALCYALNKKAVPFTSLECLAYNGGKDENAVAVADAKQGKSYAQAFRGGVPATGIDVVENAALSAYLAEHPGKVVSDYDISAFTAAPFDYAEEVSEGLKNAFYAHTPVEGAALAPLYVRPSQADEGTP